MLEWASSNTAFRTNCILANDIDMKDVEWTPVSLSNATFDGQGHTISNLTVTASSGGYAGFIGFLGSSATVKNLTLTNVKVTGTDETG